MQQPDVQQLLTSHQKDFKTDYSGNEIITQCWFCDDHHRHLYISNENGCFICHRCNVKGSWLDLVKSLENGIAPVISSVQPTMAIALPQSPQPLDPQLVEQYHRNLPDPILAYLKSNQRGLTEETIEKFQIGWDGSRIIIPVYSETGELVNIRRRQNPASEFGEKILGEKGCPVSIFNAQVLPLARTHKSSIVVAEGEFDAMICTQKGFTAVSGTGGAGVFKPEWVPYFEDIPIIYISYDTDEAGKSGALMVAKLFGDRARIVNLPHDGNNKIDLTIYFATQKHTPADFLQLLSQAQPFQTDAYTTRLNEAKEIVVERENMTYVLKPSSHRHDVTLRLSGQLIHQDIIDLRSAHSRQKFANSCQKNNSRVSNQQVANDLIEISDRFKRHSSQPDFTKTKPEGFTPKQEDIQKAEALLNSPTLMYGLFDAIKMLGVAGESENALIVYLVAFSCKGDDPLSLVIKGESSIGKSYLAGSVLKLIPEDEYRDLTDATAQSFYYVEDNYFAHKLVVIFEIHGQEKSDYTLRSLQSEGKLKIQTTIKDADTGRFTVEVREVPGPIGYVTTTTRPRIHPENETRLLSIYPDESMDQTYRTFTVTDAKYRGKLSIDESTVRAWKTAHQLLPALKVQIPFVEEIRDRFPKKPVRVRRDYGKLLAMIAVIANLHQKQRQIVKASDGSHVVIANLVDFHLAKLILEPSLKKTIFSLPPKSEEVLVCIKDLTHDHDFDFGVTTTDISRVLDWNSDTVNKWIRPAIKQGYVICLEDPRGNKPGKYKASDKELLSQDILPNTQDLYAINPTWLGDQILYDPFTGEQYQLKETADVPTS